MIIFLQKVAASCLWFASKLKESKISPYCFPQNRMSIWRLVHRLSVENAIKEECSDDQTATEKECTNDENDKDCKKKGKLNDRACKVKGKDESKRQHLN